MKTSKVFEQLSKLHIMDTELTNCQRAGLVTVTGIPVDAYDVVMSDVDTFNEFTDAGRSPALAALCTVAVNEGLDLDSKLGRGMCLDDARTILELMELGVYVPQNIYRFGSVAFADKCKELIQSYLDFAVEVGVYSERVKVDYQVVIDVLCRRFEIKAEVDKYMKDKGILNESC